MCIFRLVHYGGEDIEVVHSSLSNNISFSIRKIVMELSCLTIGVYARSSTISG